MKWTGGQGPARDADRHVRGGLAVYRRLARLLKAELQPARDGVGQLLADVQPPICGQDQMNAVSQTPGRQV